MSNAPGRLRYAAWMGVTPVTRPAVTPDVFQFSPQVTATVTSDRHPRRTTLLDPFRHPSPTDGSNLRAYADDVQSLINNPVHERDARAAINSTLDQKKSIASNEEE